MQAVTRLLVYKVTTWQIGYITNIQRTVVLISHVVSGSLLQANTSGEPARMSRETGGGEKMVWGLTLASLVPRPPQLFTAALDALNRKEKLGKRLDSGRNHAYVIKPH